MTYRNGTEVARDSEGVKKRDRSYLEADKARRKELKSISKEL